MEQTRCQLFFFTGGGLSLQLLKEGANLSEPWAALCIEFLENVLVKHNLLNQFKLTSCEAGGGKPYHYSILGVRLPTVW